MVICLVVLGTFLVLRTQGERIALSLGDLLTPRFGEGRNISIEFGKISGSLIDDVRLMEILIEKVPIADIVSKYIKGFKLTGIKKLVDVHNVQTGVASMEYKTTVRLKTE